MNKTCARCEKTVYPTEELKCLDKVWHKGCFKCQECGMTLNMRTYKGYGKLPYCESHVPKAKHTTMAETPELKRIAENTKIQSNVKYHADFEKSKGKFTQVADDPETLRIKANTKIISNVAYHGDLEKKAQMEKQRQINENGEIVELPGDNYHQQIDTYATEMLSNAPPPNLPPKTHYQTPTTHQSRSQYQERQTYPDPPRQYQESRPVHQESRANQDARPNHQEARPNHQEARPNHQEARPNHQEARPNHQDARPNHQDARPNHQSHQTQQYQDRYVDNRPYQPQYAPDTRYQEPNRQFQEMSQYQTQDYYKQNNDYQQFSGYDSQLNQYAYGQYTQPNFGVSNQQKIGRIQDYDPLSDGPRVPPNTQRASATLVYNSANDSRQKGAHQTQQQQPRQIGRVTDMDPVADEPRMAHPQQKVFIAMYDYEANDSDEVSFKEGDTILNVTSIDEGWMTGQVLRTGQTGMLPANYVELAPPGGRY